MYQLASSSQVNPNVRMTPGTGRLMTVAAQNDLQINSMADITQGVTTGDLVIRTYDSTGTQFRQTVQYPIISIDSGSTMSLAGRNVGVALKSPISFHVDTTTFGDNSTTNLWYDANAISSEPFGRPQRLRGRTLHRQNHRGLAPRAVSVDFSTATPAEIQALQLLRGLVGQDEFRRYLKYGFIMVRGGSGLRYQVRRGRHVVDVWNERGRVDGICVYLQGQFPPTDDTITRMLMAERDELELWRRGNSRAGRGVTAADLERLYRGAKKVAA